MDFFLRKYVYPVIIWLIYKSIFMTWRLVVSEPDALKELRKEGKPFILAHWHGDELVLLGLIQEYRVATIASTSKDGEMMNTLVKFMGGTTSRGSSTRGAVNALKGLVRIFKNEKRSTSFAVDGPKGPIYQVKPGVFEFSRLTEGPIYCAGISCDRKWSFPKAWNKTYLPKPFAKVVVRWEGPIGPVTRDQDPRSPELAQIAKDALQNAQTTALKKMDDAASFG